MKQQKHKKHRAAHAPDPASSADTASPSAAQAQHQEDMAELITALVLGGLALLRPWHDGMALPTINDYYIWVQIALFALVSARLLMRGEPLRFPLLVTLFAAFIGVAVLSTLDTAQYDNSYRALIVWSGHFFLFVVAAQTLRQPRSFAIVLSGFVAGALAEAVFSVMHLKYYIPLVRDRVKMDPSLVQRYFSAPELNPEIARRLNTNRAFGTFLFPNALAGYMVLCVPFALGAGAYSIRTLRALLQRTAERPPKRNPTEAAATGFVSWVATLVIAYTAHSFFFAVAYRDAPMSAHWIQWTLSVGIFPLVVGTILYFVTKKHSVLAALWSVAACILPVFAVATFLALFYSFSRGGMLAFLAATLFTGGLLFVLLRKPRLLPARWTGVALLLLACVVLISTMDTQAATRPSSELITEGVDMTIGELANPATMLLRVTYWRTALYMIADNFWTGVGPGNFGVMYPRYKYVTAGETKHAHNDYLQVFAETGILGALVFYAFWAVFVVAGLRRLVQMRSSPRLWLLAGLFAGVFAFLLHAVVDFDFFNPSLATAAFLLSGLFCAATTNPPPQEPTHGYARPIAVVFLVLSAIALTASVRVHRADALAGSEPEFRTKLLAAQFFVFDAPERYADDRQSANIPLRDAIAIIPDLEALEECGSFWVAEPGKKPRKLSPHEPLWPNAFLKVTNPEVGREIALEGVKEALARLKDADAIFPHDPIRAVQVSTWCDFLSDAAESRQQQLEWSDQAVEWAYKALERSPHEAWFHEQYASALWSRAQISRDADARLQDFFKSLEHYRQSTVLFPSSAIVWKNYAQKLRQLGDILKQSGKAEKGKALQEKAEESAARAEKIRAADYRANRRRAGLE